MNKFTKIFLFFSLALMVTIKFWPKQADKSSQEKVLHLALESQIQTLDPAVSSSLHEGVLIGKVYEGLLEYHYLKRPFELTANLAEAMPIISEDGLTYTFTIKKGVYFHNNSCFPGSQGREVTAEDFVYSFKRIADPSLHAPFFSELVPIIKGLRAFYEHLKQHKGDYSASIEGIQALDRYTLQFTLTAKFPILLHYLAHPSTNVVAKEAVDHYGPNFINHPVGTGPFTLGEFNPQSNKVIFIKNQHFRDKFFPTEIGAATDLVEAAGKKLPFLDKIIYHTLYEEQPRWLEFKEKKIDVIEVQIAYISQVFENQKFSEALSQGGVTLLEAASPRISYIGFNCLTKPLDNLKLRQAMSLAFDRATFKKIFTANLATIRHSFIPDSFVGYSETFVNPYVTYDLEKAKQYLAEAGYPEKLPTLILETSASSTIKQQMEFFAKCMEKIGIKVEVHQQIFPELAHKINKGNYMIATLSEHADYPDAAAIFKVIRNKSLETGIAIDDQTFNELYDQAIQTAPNTPQKEILYEKLNTLAASLTPALLIPSLPLYILTNPRVKYYRISPYSYGMEQYVDVV